MSTSGNDIRINGNYIPFVLTIGDSHKLSTYLKDLSKEEVGSAVDRLRKFVEELDFSVSTQSVLVDGNKEEMSSDGS